MGQLSATPAILVRHLARDSWPLAYPLIREGRPDVSLRQWLESVEQLVCTAEADDVAGVLAAGPLGSIRGACTYSVCGAGGCRATLNVSDLVVLELLSPPERTAEALARQIVEIATKASARSIELGLPPMSDWVGGLDTWQRSGLPVVNPNESEAAAALRVRRLPVG